MHQLHHVLVICFEARSCICDRCVQPRLPLWNPQALISTTADSTPVLLSVLPLDTGAADMPGVSQEDPLRDPQPRLAKQPGGQAAHHGQVQAGDGREGLQALCSGGALMPLRSLVPLQARLPRWEHRGERVSGTGGMKQDSGMEVSRCQAQEA